MGVALPQSAGAICICILLEAILLKEKKEVGIETDDDFHEPDEKEAARLYGTLKPMQQRRF